MINGVSGKTFVICVILKDCSPCGESLASFQLVKNKVHPPFPFYVFAFCVSILQLGPNVVKVFI